MAKSFLNPFDEGVTYEAFIASIPKDKKLKDHCKDELTDEQIKFLELEIEILNNNNK